MNINQILNKVSDGGYTSLSNSEFNELKKYPEHKELFNKISDSGYASLSESEFNGLKTLSLPKSTQETQITHSLTQDQYKLLQQNVGNYGYSGLDEVQKKQFRDQFPSSKFAKAGGKFEDAVAYVDSQSSYNPQGRENDGMNTSDMGDNTTLSGALKNTWMGIKDVGNQAKEHPGTTALMLASGFFPEMLPLTTGGVVRSGVAGMAARAIDKQHPFTSEMPDYRNEKPMESATDVLGAGAGSALGQMGTIGLVKGVGAIAAPMMRQDAKIAEVIEKNRLADEAIDAKNLSAREVVDARNLEIARQNEENARYLKLLRDEGLADPNFKLESLRRRMMADQPDVSGAFAGDKTGNEFFDALAETRRVGDYGWVSKNRQIADELARRRQLDPSYSAENIKPSDWDVARKMAELKRGIPEVSYPEPIPYGTPIEIPPRQGNDLLVGVPGLGALHNGLVNAEYPVISGLVKGLNLRNNFAIPEAAKAWAVPLVEGSGLSPLGKLVTPFAVGGGTKAYDKSKDVFEGYRNFMKWKKETGEDIQTAKDVYNTIMK